MPSIIRLSPPAVTRSLALIALVFATACGSESDSPDAGSTDTAVDASVDVAGDVDATQLCEVPVGAHPSVGAAVPAAGWRCIRDPRPLSAPRDVIVTRDGHILVTEFGAGRVVRVGADDIEVIAEGLTQPIGLRELGNGNLLVAEERLGTVAELDAATGARTELAAGLNAVTYLTLGDNDDAYVSSFREVAATGTGIVWRVELSTGDATEYATGLHVPEGLFVGDDGLRVVEWFVPSAVVEFGDAGADGTVVSDGYDQAYGLVSDGAGGHIVGDHAGRIVWEQADGTSTVILSGIGRPGGMAWMPDGTLLIAEFVDFGATGYLIRLEPI